ncbi:unnamed protein product [Chrysoparadoxa australica]
MAQDPGQWLGLLKWSLQYHDGTGPSANTPMSEEDKEWLSRVMQDSVRDDVKVMTDVYEAIRSFIGKANEGEAAEGRDDLLKDLEDLQDMCEQIDLANTWVKIAGPSCLLDLARTSDHELQVASLSVLGTVAQNNPLAQSELANAGQVEELLALLQLPSSPAPEGPAFKAAVLGALSRVVRGYEEGELKVLEPDTMKLMCGLFESQGEAFRRRLLFLARALVEGKGAARVDAVWDLLLLAVSKIKEENDVDVKEKTIEARALIELP